MINIIKFNAKALGLLCLALLPVYGLASVTPGEKKTNPVSSLGLKGEGVSMAQPDPKRPGKYLWTLRAKEFSLQSPQNTVSGTVLNISATLYQNGAPAAILIAPKAKSDNVRSTIIASGGISIKSLSEPGTKLQADKMIWYAGQNKIVASGHVYYRNGKSGMTISCPELVADTKLKSVRSSNGGQVVFPKNF